MSNLIKVGDLVKIVKVNSRSTAKNRTFCKANLGKVFKVLAVRIDTITVESAPGGIYKDCFEPYQPHRIFRPELKNV